MFPRFPRKIRKFDLLFEINSYAKFTLYPKVGKKNY